MLPERTIIDPNTEDLPVPDMLEYILKRMTKMQLSHPELNMLKNHLYRDLRVRLITLRDLASYQLDRFLDLGLSHYNLRKRLSGNDPPCYSDLADNNMELSKAFLHINKTISEYDLARIRLDL